jgi:cold shock CspA family protein
MSAKTKKGVGFLLTDDNKDVWVSVGDNRIKVSVSMFLLMASAIKVEWEEQHRGVQARGLQERRSG